MGEMHTQFQNCVRTVIAGVFGWLGVFGGFLPFMMLVSATEFGSTGVHMREIGFNFAECAFFGQNGLLLACRHHENRGGVLGGFIAN